jgi:hypothetical protein
MPSFGVSYQDPATKETYFYAVAISGMDGSVSLSYIESNNNASGARKIPTDEEILVAYADELTLLKSDPEADTYKYVLADLDGNHTKEMVIFQSGKVRYVCGYNGVKLTKTLWGDTDSQIYFYDNSTAVVQSYDIGADKYYEEWYKFNANVDAYLPFAQHFFKEDGFGNEIDSEYYSMALNGDWEEFENNYFSSGGMWPAWAGEWGGMLTEEEYNSLLKDLGCDSCEGLEIPAPTPVTEFEGF